MVTGCWSLEGGGACIVLNGAAWRNVARQQFIDVMVLDPPRIGCPGKVLSSVNRLRPKRIVYVSCNPATQARDCRFFADHGYTLQSLQPFDMFPQTSHIEVVALLVPEDNILT